MPRTADLLRDIHETNITYLTLLQRLASQRQGLTVAGITLQDHTWHWLEALPPQELHKLAKSSHLLSQINLSSADLLSALARGISAMVPTPAANVTMEA